MSSSSSSNERDRNPQTTSSSMDPPWTIPLRLTPEDLLHHKNHQDGIGRYKTMEEVEIEEKPIQSWWVMLSEGRPSEYVRPTHKVQSRLVILKDLADNKKLPEYDDYWPEKLLADLERAHGQIRNIVAMDLGSLCYSDDFEFEKAARAHVFAFKILKVLSDAAKESRRLGNTKDTMRGAVFVCEDVHYGRYDLDFLRMDYLSDGTEGWLSDGRIRPYASNGGMGWFGTDGGNGDYIFITFNPRNPIRQLLALLLRRVENLTDDERKEIHMKGTSALIGRVIKPRAIVCRDANKSDEDNHDPIAPHVKDWFKKYYNQVHKFGGDKIFGEDIYLYTLKPNV